MPEDTRTVQVRVTPELKRAVQIIVGRMQERTGEYYSWSDGLWEYLKEVEPDVVETAQKMEQKDK